MRVPSTVAAANAARSGAALAPAMVDLFARHPQAFGDYLEFRRETEGFAAHLAALRATLMRDHPSFSGVDYAPGAATALDLSAVGVPGEVDPAPFASPIIDFHLTNPIARASTVMAECSAARKAAAAPIRHAAE